MNVAIQNCRVNFQRGKKFEKQNQARAESEAVNQNGQVIPARHVSFSQKPTEQSFFDVGFFYSWHGHQDDGDIVMPAALIGQPYQSLSG